MVGVNVVSSVQINMFGDEVVFRLNITCKKSGYEIQHVQVVFALCLLLLS